jgi:hypothetical protein
LEEEVWGDGIGVKAKAKRFLGKIEGRGPGQWHRGKSQGKRVPRKDRRKRSGAMAWRQKVETKDRDKSSKGKKRLRRKDELSGYQRYRVKLLLPAECVASLSGGFVVIKDETGVGS